VDVRICTFLIAALNSRGHLEGAADLPGENLLSATEFKAS
jgi:hypothetical protein